MNDNLANRLRYWARFLGFLVRFMRHPWFLRILVAINGLLAIVKSVSFHRFVMDLDVGLLALSASAFFLRNVFLKYSLDWYFRPGGAYDQEEEVEKNLRRIG